MELVALGIAGAAIAALCGVCIAETLLLREVLRLLRQDPERWAGGGKAPPEAAEDPRQTEEEALRSAAMQEGFDNLMRYTTEMALGKGDLPC